MFSFQGFVSGITGIVTKPIKGMLTLTLALISAVSLHMILNENVIVKLC